MRRRRSQSCNHKQKEFRYIHSQEDLLRKTFQEAILWVLPKSFFNQFQFMLLSAAVAAA